MFKRVFKTTFPLIFLLIGLMFGQCGSAWGSEIPIYLSFEQRIVATAALAAIGEKSQTISDIVEKTLKLFETYVDSKPQYIQVNTVEEFLDALRGQWPNSHAVSVDLELLFEEYTLQKKVYYSNDPKIQKIIDGYFSEQLSYLMNLAQIELPQSVLIDSEIDIEKINKNIQAAISKLKQFKTNFEQIGQQVSEKAFGKIKDPALRVVLQTIISGYFNQLSLKSKKQIISSFLGGNLRFDDPIKIFEVMLQNSGPQIQKFIQIVSRLNDIPPEIKKVFSQMEDSIKPSATILVRRLFDSEAKNFGLTRVDLAPAGVGAMAQVHFGEIQPPETLFPTKVVTRFIKFGIAERVEEDHQILSQLAPIIDNHPDYKSPSRPKIAALIDDITAGVRAELDLLNTLQNQIKASETYTGQMKIKYGGRLATLSFNVPKIILGKSPSSSLMVQERVFGQKVNEINNLNLTDDPYLARSIVEGLAEFWIEHALFTTGNYHADLHPGNFFVELLDIFYRGQIRIHLMDFGMWGQLTNDVKEKLQSIAVGTFTKRSDLIFENIWDLSVKEKNQISKEDFRKFVLSTLEAQSRGSVTRLKFYDWIGQAINHGIAFPEFFVNLNRGLVTVDMLLLGVGSNLNVTKIATTYLFRHPGMTYKVLTQARLSGGDLFDLSKNVLQNHFNKKSIKNNVFQCSELF